MGEEVRNYNSNSIYLPQQFLSRYSWTFSLYKLPHTKFTLCQSTWTNKMQTTVSKLSQFVDIHSRRKKNLNVEDCLYLHRCLQKQVHLSQEAHVPKNMHLTDTYIFPHQIDFFSCCLLGWVKLSLKLHQEKPGTKAFTNIMTMRLLKYIVMPLFWWTNSFMYIP